MVSLIRHDLQFILDQIVIAEQNASTIQRNADGTLSVVAGTPLTQLIPDPHLPFGLRTVDGTYNNLVPGRETYGSADQVMPRLLDTNVPDIGEVWDPDGPGPAPAMDTSYTQFSGSVADSQPRVISNLVADQTFNNPAAIHAALAHAGLTGAERTAAFEAIQAAVVTYRQDLATAQSQVDGAQALLDGLAPDNPSYAFALSVLQQAEAARDAVRDAFVDALATYDVSLDGESDNILLPNVAPDEGLTAPFNSWMTLFGQFFDHGLDLVKKGGSGTVFIPLQPDDPLYVPGGHSNFMVLTRATNQPGPDGVLGTADDVREHENATTPWVDQNQTYTSHASHQVFLREYEFSVDTDGDGVADAMPVATGHLLEGADGGLATWADVKRQARELLGIDLTDANVQNVPLLATDEYGRFLRGENGLPLVVFPDGDGHRLVEGDLAAPISLVGAVSTGHAFLEDIAHNAVPRGMIDHDRNPATDPVLVAPDADDVAGNTIIPNQFGFNLTYDDELLDAHYIVGDGRGNENIGLTAVHHVFHSEHNRLVEHVKEVVLSSGDLAFINAWLDAPLTELPAADAALDWNGERLFQAARFTTEMQYQHLVFEEFARRVQPAVDLFVFNNITEVDPAIVAEFAHVVYRFGHSMLNETVDRVDIDTGAPVANDIGLIEAFLNPVEFARYGDADAAAGAIVRGMTLQRGNEIDEFVTSALRDNLVGLPLDLAALNIARGRDTGVPTLNEARQTFYEQSGSTWLKPYTSWVDFAQNLKNPASIINFIAAYGEHDTVKTATTVADKREAATKIVLGGTDAPADRTEFLNGTGLWQAVETGLNKVEFWIGGLAEAIMPFGGMLGSTFAYVFEAQMENLQNADRFYYLTRTQGMNLLNELENNSFASIIMRNTDIGEGGPHIPGEVFARVDHVLEVNRQWQTEADPVHDDPILEAFSSKVERATVTLADGTIENHLAFNGGEHVVLGGTDDRDVLTGGDGDDTIWGDGGNDRIEGGHGINHLRGGAGDDIITDGGDISFLHGEDGNDVISAGRGAGELIFGGAGKDVIIVGEDGKEAFGGTGDDFIIGGPGGDFLLGNEGSDWIEGGDGFDVIAGDNSELFFNSTIQGHDVMFAGPNENDFDAESGDDIMVQGESVMRNEGMFGFDWVTHKGSALAADIDLGRKIFATDTLDILRNRYDRVEGASGWVHDDLIVGDDRSGADLAAGVTAGQNETTLFMHELTKEGIERIAGLTEVVTGSADPVPVDFAWTGGNILLGGGGSDTIMGKDGDDVIDGDSWLNVRILIKDTLGNDIATADGLTQAITVLDEAYSAWEGRTIQALSLEGAINPVQLNIVREILDGDAADTAVDTAVYRYDMSEYTILANEDGSITVQHNNANPELPAPDGGVEVEGPVPTPDGTDRLINIERIQFADGVIDVADIVARPIQLLNIVGGGNGQLEVDHVASDAITGYRWEALVNGVWTEVGSGPTLNGNLFSLQELRAVATYLGGEIVSTQTAIIGTAAADRFDGTDVANILVGRNDDDRIDGGAGDDLIIGGAGLDRLQGGEGADDIRGGAGDDTLDGGVGDDLLSGGAGDDVITWHPGDGFDIVAGGADGAVGDTFAVEGDETAESYVVYTRPEAIAAGFALQHNGTDILVTRNGAAIAELRGIEEIVFDFLGDAGDTVAVVGNFDGTALAPNTITINGTAGDDTIDISQLTSAHRILFRSNGGEDHIVGALRPQDVIQLAPGAALGDYTETDNGDGTKTLSNGAHKITFAASGQPTFQEVSTTGEPVGGTGGGTGFVLTARDIAGLKALVQGLTPPGGGDDAEGALGVRTLSGEGNNVDEPLYGTADQPFIRLTEARYGAGEVDGNRAINPIFDGLDPRTISNVLGAQEAGLPKAASGANAFFTAFGQYFDHGLDFVAKGGSGVLPIGGPGVVRGTDNTADLTRASVVGTDADGNPLHVNKTSPFVDQNQAYGSHELVGQFLRESDGNGGFGARLLDGADDPSAPGFKMLPTLREAILHHWEADTVFVDPSLPGGAQSFRSYYAGLVDGTGAIDGAMVKAMAGNFMGSTHALLLDVNPFIDLLDHYVAGDGRVNENVGLTSIHTIWARNHNFHVDNLIAAGFEGTDEELFQAAKIVNEGEYQAVVWGEFADVLLGGMRGSGRHGHDEYDPAVDASISHEFAAAAYRFGHSLVAETLTVLDENGNPKDVRLFDLFLNPTNAEGVFTAPLPPGYVPQPGMAQLGTGSVLGGIMRQMAEEADFNVVDALRNDLVRNPADLFAFNVARGWDLGLGTLNQIRAGLSASESRFIVEAIGHVGGDLTPYASWEDFQQRNGLSDAIIAQFKEAYPDLVLDTQEKIDAFTAANPDLTLVNGNTVKGIDRVDFWVGGLAEAHVNGGMVGATFWVVLHEQLDRLQEGDRFYYTDRLDGFDLYVNEFETIGFAGIIERNTGLTGLPENVFLVDDEDGAGGDDGGNDEGEDDDGEDGDGGAQDDGEDDGETGEGDGQDDGEDDGATGSPATGGGSSGGSSGGTGAAPGPRVGTAATDVLIGTALAEALVALAGEDVVMAAEGDDTVSAGADDDVVEAGAGADIVMAGSGDDAVFGGAGDDTLFGDAGRDRVFGGDGNDLIDAGAGDDDVFGGAGDDLFRARVGDGDDLYVGDALGQNSGIDTLDMSAIAADATIVLGGGPLHQGYATSAQSGTDTLYGVENVIAGSGDDTIVAGATVNVLTGGGGDDTFRFESVAAADGDTITDLEPGDRLDFSAIDAVRGDAVDQAFTIVTGAAATAAGQLAVSWQETETGTVTVIEGHVDGDGQADFTVRLDGARVIDDGNTIL